MDSYRKTSVLMFPWLGHGHISPFLELAKRLTKRNFIIHLCSTPANLHSVEKILRESKFFRSIKLVPLELSSSPDLPPNLHTTNGLPSHLMPTLKQAFDNASTDFCQILQTVKPDLLIYDLIQPWAAKAALAFSIPAVVFITTSATMASNMFHLYFNHSVKFPFPTIYYRDYENSHKIELLESSANGIKDKDRVIESVGGSSNIVLIKSFKEIEGKYSDYLSLLTGKKIVPVGPLVQDPSQEDLDSDNHIIQWLDTKGQGSTIFVSFGSEYFLSNEDFEEIAHGLEMSNVNFIWVVRFPKGEKKIRIEEALPKGFLERAKGRGLVEEGWAPQARILEHKSIGGFVSHCGWSSVMESMKFGVPIIAMPMHLDQPVNARLVEEVGIGVEVVRDMNGRLEREEVAAVIKHVVVDKVGEDVRERARKMSDNIGMKGEGEIDRVVEEIEQLCHSSIQRMVNKIFRAFLSLPCILKGVF